MPQMNRRYWLSELKRAKLDKQIFVDKMMRENFSALDPYNADEKLNAVEFCEAQHRHFITSLENWINDNYPAGVKQQTIL